MLESEDSVRELASRLPKSQLHLHLDGSLPESFLTSQASNLGLTLPAPASSLRAHLLSQKAAAFASNGYIQDAGANWDVFNFCNAFLQTIPALQQATHTVVAHLANKSNCWVIEIRFSPALHTHQGLSQDDAVSAVVDGFHTGAQQAHRRVRGGVILCALRSYPASHTAETIQLASRWLNRGVVGFDLAGDEASYPLSLHERPIRDAVGVVPLTLHAGEQGVHGHENLRLAIELGAKRIGHALVLKDDKELCISVRESGVYVETCISANCSGGHKVPADRFELHPVKELLGNGVKVAGFNCDNLLLSGTMRSRPDPTEEIVRAKIGCGLSWRQIREVLVNGAEASFDDMGSEKERDRFVMEFSEAVDDVLAEVLGND